MHTNSYDVIVLGDQTPGLIAATLCASRGLRVLVLESRIPQHVYRIGSYQLPIQPLPFAGYSSPVIRRVLDSLNLEHALKRQLDVQEQGFQLVGPDTRINVGGDDSELRREIERELGGPRASDYFLGASKVCKEFGGVLENGTQLFQAGFWDRRDVARVEAKINGLADEWAQARPNDAISHPLLSLVAALTLPTAPAMLTSPAIARCFGVWRDGVPRFPQDGETLRQLLLEKFGNHSGEVRQGAATGLQVRWNRVTGVELDTGERLGAGHVLLASPISELARLFGSKPSRRLLRSCENIAPVAYRYTLNLVVDSGGIPPGMARTVLAIVDPDRPATNGNAFAVYRTAPDRDGRVTVTVTTTSRVPDKSESIQDVFGDLRVKLRQNLEMIMPFFAQHVLLAHSPYESTPAEGMEQDDFEAIPPCPVWESQFESHFGVSGVPFATGVKQVTCASNQVLPGLGVEGDFYTAWVAAKQACAAVGKRRTTSMLASRAEI